MGNTKIVKIAIFATSFVLSIAILFNLFSDPLTTSKTIMYLFLLIFFAICVNLGLSILRDFVNLSQNRWVFYLIQWVLTLLIPLSLLLLIEHPLQKMIMADVAKSMKPTLEYIQKYKREHGFLPKKIKADAKSDGIKYYHTDQFYMLSKEIFSTTTDIETIYFSSRENRWFRFHNDQYNYYKDKKIIPPNLKEYIRFTH